MLGALTARTSATRTAAAALGLGRLLAPAAAAEYARHGTRLSSTAAGNAPVAATATGWRQRFDGVAPGSVLRLALRDTSASVAMHVGEHEAIELSSSSDSPALQTEQQPHPEHAGASIVTVTGSSAAGFSQPQRLQVLGPSRFFTLEAATGGGSVHVDVVQEGSLHVSTHGGDIAVPKVKAIQARLASGGGAIAGSVTGVDVRLDSGGGPVSLKSLVGKRADVRSGGGALALGACYADQLQLDSGGGPVAIGTMDCRGGAASLASAGGVLQLDSLDGNLQADSGGGTVQIQLADNAGDVRVASGGGAIRAFLSPGLTGRLLVRNCGRVHAAPAALALAQPQGDGSLLFQLPLEAPAGAGGAASGQQLASRLQRAAAAPPPPGNAIAPSGRVPAGADIVLDAGGGELVTLQQRGWMEALRQRVG